MFGLSLIVIGNADFKLTQWDTSFAIAQDGEPHNKRDYGGQMRESAEACLALCNDVDTVNDFVVCLMCAVYTLQSYYEGDDSKPRPDPQESSKIRAWLNGE